MSARSDRVASRTRNVKWLNAPVRIEMAECINCDACLRACPPHFGAIFNHGVDVVVIPELCSGLRQMSAGLSGELHLSVS
jgi:Na+-translocating ferredoxin:NAD+ oxidoreductase subunit B